MAKPRLGFEITAEDKSGSAFASLSKNIDSSTAALAKLGVVAAGVALGRFVVGVVESVDELQDFAGQVGIGVAALTRLQYAASTVGIGADKFNTILQRMTVALGQAADGAKKPADALARIGVNVEAIKDLAPEQVFSVIAEGLSRITNNNERAAIAADLFGGKNVKILRLFKDGAAGLAEYSKEADRLGFTLTDKAAGAFDTAASAIEGFDAGLTAASRTIAVQFAPLIQSIGDKLPAAANKFAAAMLVIKLSATAGASGIARLFNRDATADALVDQTNAYLEELRKLNAPIVATSKDFDDLAASAAALVNGPLPRIADTTERAKEAQKAYNAELALAKGYFESAQTPAEKLTATLLEIEQLRGRGRLSGTTADRAGLQALIAEEEALQRSRVNPAAEAARARGVALFNETRTATERNLIAQTELNQLYDKGAISVETYARAALAANIAEEESIEGIGKGLDAGSSAIKKILEQIQANTDRTANGIVDSFFNAGSKISDIFLDLGNVLARALFKQTIADPLAGAFTSAITGIIGGAGSGSGGFDFSSLKLFGKARGGPLSDRPTLVGERGPEIIDSAGNVRPGGGGGVNISFTVNSLDPRTAASVIVANRDAIIGVIRGAFGRQGTAVRLA